MICPNLALGVDSRKFVATTRKFPQRPLGDSYLCGAQLNR